MDSIEKLLKKPPEHNFQIIFEGSEPSMIIYEPITEYKVLEKFGGKCVKLGNGGTTFDPCIDFTKIEFTKLPDDMKDKLTAEAIKIIEKREKICGN